MLKKKKIALFAGGGTGGHVYPALALADVLCKKEDQYQALFVGTKRGLEAKVIPKTTHKIEYIPMGMFNRNAGRKAQLVTLFLLPFAFLKSIWIILKYRPEFVFGVGGYASVPIVFMASLLGIKTYIWEPNAQPGLANRFLSKYVDQVFVVFDHTLSSFQSKNNLIAGMPIRPIFDERRAGECKKFPQGRKAHLFIFGGSQGARRINEVVSEMILKNQSLLDHWVVIHQTGDRDFDSVRDQYQLAGVGDSVQCLAYIEDMIDKYNWADLVVSRAGASSISELAAMNKPAVLIPYPYAADNHQQKNAEELEKKKAAVMLLQKDLTAESLKASIEQILQNPSEHQMLSQNISHFYQPQAAEKIVQVLLQN